MTSRHCGSLSAVAERICALWQEYIENENARLEREHQFWQREIVVKIEYKFCPNLTIIDTPGQSLPLNSP